MDNPDRPEGALSPWSPTPLVARPSPEVWDEPAAAAPPPRLFTPKVALRAIRRHWWLPSFGLFRRQK